MNLAWAVLIVVGSYLAGLFGTRIVLEHLRKRAILDHPNARSSHAAPTPRGGGLAVVPVLLLAWVLIKVVTEGDAFHVGWPIAGALILGFLSWWDDVRGLGALLRLTIQAVAVAVGLLALAGRGAIFQGLLPMWLDRAVAGVAWLWFVNLFNFMDGIDGIAGGETAVLGIGIALIAFKMGQDPALVFYGLTAAAVALGFLWWNWHPARIFLGDVGSVPLGYLLGWLLLEFAAQGMWAAALILPSYYLADATLTLLRRLLRGERIWVAHREHFYQRAVQHGRSHAEVVKIILIADGLLVGLALWSAAWQPWIPLACAAGVVICLLFCLAKSQPE